MVSSYVANVLGGELERVCGELVRDSEIILQLRKSVFVSASLMLSLPMDAMDIGWSPTARSIT